MVESQLEKSAKEYETESCPGVSREIRRAKYTSSAELEIYIGDCIYLMGGVEGTPSEISESTKDKTLTNLIRLSLLNKGLVKPLATIKHYFQKQQKQRTPGVIEVMIYDNPSHYPNTYNLTVQFHDFEDNAFYKQLFNILQDI